jgi:hypothetical protein
VAQVYTRVIFYVLLPCEMTLLTPNTEQPSGKNVVCDVSIRQPILSHFSSVKPLISCSIITERVLRDSFTAAYTVVVHCNNNGRYLSQNFRRHFLHDAYFVSSHQSHKTHLRENRVAEYEIRQN